MVLAGQFRIGEALSDNMRSKFFKPIPVVHRLLAIVVAECLFVEIAEQVERLDAHIGSVDPALQERPEIFESVGVNLPLDVFLSVVNHFVAVLLRQTVIGLERIAVERGSSSNVGADLFLDCFLAAVGNDGEANFATAFQHSHHGGFVLAASSGDSTLALIDVHVASLAADESFIHFNLFAVLTELQKGFALHGKTDAVHHKPCGLLSDTKGAAHFVGTDSVLAIGDHPQSGKPFIEPNRRILEDSSNLRAELPVMVDALALPLSLIGEEVGVLASASGAGNAFRPAQFNHELEAVVGIGEVDDGFLKCLWLGHVRHQRQDSPEHVICQVYYCPL